jgi:hypothetical protein
VLVGVIVKWLGIVPAIAYNLIIPTMFSLIALGAFSIGWNLIGYSTNGTQDQRSGIKSLKTIVGLAAAFGMAVLGNLGIVRMIYQGYQRLAAPDGNIEAASILTRWIWAAEGAVKAFLGTSLPYGIADWYWNPSRVIPAPNEVEPITEFPFLRCCTAICTHICLPCRSRCWRSLGIISFVQSGLERGSRENIPDHLFADRSWIRLRWVGNRSAMANKHLGSACLPGLGIACPWICGLDQSPPW